MTLLEKIYTNDKGLIRGKNFFYLNAHRKKNKSLNQEIEIIFSNWADAVVMIKGLIIPDEARSEIEKSSADQVFCLTEIEALNNQNYSCFFPSKNSPFEIEKNNGSVILARDKSAVAILEAIEGVKKYKHPEWVSKNPLAKNEQKLAPSTAALEQGIKAREAGNYAEARRILLSIEEQHPEPWKVYFQLSLAETDSFTALQWIKKSIKFKDCPFPPIIHAVDLLLALDKLEPAEKLLRRAEKIPRKNIFRFYMTMGKLAQAKNTPQQAIVCFLKALEFSPQRFLAYQSCAIATGELYLKYKDTESNNELDLIITPLSLLERWLLSQAQISLVEISAKLKRLGVQHYVVSPGGSGIGDRLVSANLSAKLMEILGLKFFGIEKQIIDRKAGRSEWWKSKNQDENLYEVIGLTQLPQIETRAEEIQSRIIEYAPTNDGNMLAWFQGLNNILDQKILSKEQDTAKNKLLKVVINTRMYSNLSPFLWDSCGNSMENGFHHALIQTRKNNTSRETFDLLWHLRLGDEANIQNIIPNCTLTPYRFGKSGEVFTNENMGTLKYNVRYDKVKEFSELSLRLKKLMPELKMGLITDGYDLSFEFLKTQEKVHQRLKDYHIDIEQLDLDALNKQYQDTFLNAFSHMDKIIYGETFETFEMSVEAIASAHTIITSSGIFVPNIVNNCSQLEQTVFLFSRGRGQFPRKHANFHYVNIDTFASKLIKHLESVQTCSS